RPRPDDSDQARKANCSEGEDYLRVILEAAGGAEVIAEDLGTVPDYVRPSLSSLGIAGMKVPQWEVENGEVTMGPAYPSLSFAAYATHDHSPMRRQWSEAKNAMETAEKDSAAWWDARNFLATLCWFAGIEMPGDVPPDYTPAIWEKLFRELSLSNSDRIAVMISDVLGEIERINVPGVMDGTNWSYRTSVSTEEFSSSEEFWPLRNSIKKVLNETSRARRVGSF
ncbi:MAG: 4-alpha-glucanotransferase, partial [Verrucomicrobiota bacterium]